MIKLFLITLVCGTLVFADSPVQDFQNAWQKPTNGFLSADHFMGRHSSLMRRSADDPLSGDQDYHQDHHRDDHHRDRDDRDRDDRDRDDRDWDDRNRDDHHRDDYRP